MKIQIIIIIAFFIFNVSGLTQAPKLIKTERQLYIADEERWRDNQKEFFEYEGDLMTKYTRQIWYQLPDKFVNHEIREYKYDENDNLILKKEYDFTGSNAQVQNFYWDEYFYDERGCPTAQKDSVSSIHGVYSQRFLEFTTDENCNIFEELIYNKTPNGTIGITKISKAFDSENLLVKDTLFRLVNDHWIMAEHWEHFYDEHQKLVEQRKEYFPSGSTAREIEQWDFDENGELIFRRKWRETSANPFKIISKDSIVIEYDERNRVEKRVVYHTRFSEEEPPDYFFYDYYCEDILKSTHTDDLPRIYRTFFEYDVGFDEDCAENLEDISVQIIPNPTGGEITLISNLLAGEDALIRVFDSTGKEYFRKRIYGLTNQTSIDLSFLKRGLFFVSIETGKWIRTERILIF